MYGPAPVDAGGQGEAATDAGTDGSTDAAVDASDAGAGVPLYGAPPFDAGRVPPRK
jgi:hypothetical protein